MGLTFLVTGRLEPSVHKALLNSSPMADFAASIYALDGRNGAHHRLAPRRPLVALYSIISIAHLMMVFPTALEDGMFVE